MFYLSSGVIQLSVMKFKQDKKDWHPPRCVYPVKSFWKHVKTLRFCSSLCKRVKVCFFSLRGLKSSLWMNVGGLWVFFMMSSSMVRLIVTLISNETITGRGYVTSGFLNHGLKRTGQACVECLQNKSAAGAELNLARRCLHFLPNRMAVTPHTHAHTLTNFSDYKQNTPHTGW